MAELELLLASSEPGERGQFHALARKFVDENKYRDYVNLLRAMDFAERRDPRSALYALRQAAQDNPDNSAVREMLKSIELGYLKAIDSKITGEAADVRARLWESLGEHGEEGFLGALKDILTTGVTGASLAIGGKYESLADLAATIGDEAQVQHSDPARGGAGRRYAGRDGRPRYPQSVGHCRHDQRRHTDRARDLRHLGWWRTARDGGPRSAGWYLLDLAGRWQRGCWPEHRPGHDGKP